MLKTGKWPADLRGGAHVFVRRNMVRNPDGESNCDLYIRRCYAVTTIRQNTQDVVHSRPRNRPPGRACRRHAAGSPNPVLRRGQGPGRQPFLRHVRAVGDTAERNGRKFGQPQNPLFTLGQGILAGVTRPPRYIGSSVPDSGPDISRTECWLPKQIEMCCARPAKRYACTKSTSTLASGTVHVVDAV